MTTPEGRVVADIKNFVKELGGIVRKVEWSGVRGAPDLLVMLDGRHAFVEVKAPGNLPTRIQLREHIRMREIGGCKVIVADSCVAFTNEFFKD